MDDERSQRRTAELPIILIAAVVQGWGLYALHVSITREHWPATEPAWLIALYAVATLIPLTVQLLSGVIRQRIAWRLIALVALLFFGFGWHHGGYVIDPADQREFVDQWLPFEFVLVVLWLLMLPFVQARIDTGRWRAPYAALFSNAWNNKLVLLEAALFTGLFWLLLMLMQQLFFMLGIAFFRELFDEPVFIYPVTSITFGIALHLIGSLERFTQLVLDQVLNVLKWLGLLAGIILTLFTIALVVKLPGLFESGERAIGAAWLLWLIAVTVLLVNAAYRDGTSERPYPRAIAFGLRLAIPLTVVIALTALYALYLRIDRYGFTVERVWASLVAAAALVYSVGYAFAAKDGQPWMRGIARVNVGVALFLIGALALMLTPALSPYRVAATSQLTRVLEDRAREVADRYEAMSYLRFSSGRYGRERLTTLAAIQDHPGAASIRVDAKKLIDSNFSWESRQSPSHVEESLRAMIVHPKGRSVDAVLLTALTKELSNSNTAWMFRSSERPVLGIFIDMNGDGAEDFVVASSSVAHIFENKDAWKRVGILRTTGQFDPNKAESVQSDDIRVETPRWKDLHIGQRVFRVDEESWELRSEPHLD